jgi:hypothetical protein
MLLDIRNEVKDMMDRGMDLNQVIEAKPTQKHDEKWGEGFMNPYRFTEIVYASLRKERSQ